MSVRELKEIISGLPDETPIHVDISHTIYDWQDCYTTIMDAEYDVLYECLYINATIKDEL